MELVGGCSLRKGGGAGVGGKKEFLGSYLCRWLRKEMVYTFKYLHRNLGHQTEH